MFWRALTGVHPAGTIAARQAARRGCCDLETPLPSIGSRDPTLPTELVAIVDRCLAKRKARALSERDRAARRSAGVPRAEGVAHDRRGRARIAGSPRSARTTRSSSSAAATRSAPRSRQLDVVAAARGDRPVGRRQVVVRPRRPRPGGARQRRRLGGARAAPGTRAARIASPTVLEDDARRPASRIGATTRCDRSSSRRPGCSASCCARQAARREPARCSSSSTSSRSCSRCATATRSRQLFLAALLAAADDPTSPVRVVLSMRADFLDRLAGHKHVPRRAVARPVLPVARPITTTCARRSCGPPSSPATRSRIRGSSRT